jgi:hypothetical protein
MKVKMKTWKIVAWGLFLSVAALVACAKRERKDEILAIVGDRIITKDEFMRRAEYTIRPPYCKRDSNLDKKIVLNSIIAEKLYAFEAGEDNPLARSATFQAYIRGRKEQFMRECLFYQIVKDKIKPDKSELNKRYRLAGREYRLAYCSIGRDVAQYAAELQKKSPNTDLFNEIYRKAGGMGPAPERAVSWKSQENRTVHNALFSEPFEKGQVIGPIQVDTDQYLMLKVLGWVDQQAVTHTSIRQRNDEVNEAWEREQAEGIWEQYILTIMKNKRLDFNKDTFEKMVELFRPLYMRSNKNSMMSFMNSDSTHEVPSAVIDSIKVKIQNKDFENRPFFTFDGKTWTLPDFMKVYASHPLVFRKKKFGDSEFPEQFKFAVADLMRDQVVNQKAYDQGIDQTQSVQAYTHMWRDALIGSYHQYVYLQTKTSNVSLGKETAKTIDRTIDEYFNAYSDSLFRKYSKKIQINIPVFEDIKLTRIDMFVQNQNVPYLEAVPAFPLLTKKFTLDYGSGME